MNSPSVPSISTLPIGSVVQVSTEDGAIKYMAHLVGMEAEKTIVTNIPSIKQFGEGGDFDKIFSESRRLIFRILGAGVVYAFKTKIIARVQCGSHLLLSSYPGEIQSRNLRKESRYPCTLASTVNFNDKSCAGLVTNISANGCQFCLADEVDDALGNDIKNYSDPVEIDIVFPFADQNTVIQAEIKSVSKKENGCLSLGMAFIDASEGVKRFLESLHLDAVSVFLK